MKDNVFSSCVIFRLHQNSCKITVCLGRRETQKRAACILTITYTGHHICYSNTVHQQSVRRNQLFPRRALDTFSTQKNPVFRRLPFNSYNQVSDKMIGLCIAKLHKNDWLLQQENPIGPSSPFGERTKNRAAQRIVLQQCCMQQGTLDETREFVSLIPNCQP